MNIKDILQIKIQILELMIFANKAEIDATFDEMKKIAGTSELNNRLSILQKVNRELAIKYLNYSKALE